MNRISFGYLTSTVITLLHKRSNLLRDLSQITLNPAGDFNLMQQ